MASTSAFVRLLAAVMALFLFAAACSDDSVDDAIDAAGAEGEESGAGSADSSEGGDDGADTPPAATGSVDCDEIQASIEQATNLGDVIGGGAGDDLEAEFQQSVAALDALGEQVPELADDVAKAQAGLAVFGDAFATIGWDTSAFEANPTEALEFARLLTDSAVIEMTGAMTNIATWLSTECAP